LTLALPKVVTAKNGQHVRAIPRGISRSRVLASSNARSSQRPLYVNPLPAPSPGGGICPGNILDIYVDGSIIPAIDGGTEAPDSLCVVQTGDGTQSVSVPLFSNASNQIVAVEWDYADQNVLAIGEADGGSFTAGQGLTLSLTMQMNVYNIGITDLAFNDPEIMNNQNYGLDDFICPASAQVAVYTADSTGSFVPIAGYGGTAPATLSGVSSSGTSKIVQTTIPGVYSLSWDGSCDYINATATAVNPAYTIYNDVTNGSQGAYPGISFLYNNSSFLPNSDSNWFADQLNYNPATGAVTIQNSGG
jgi:hypothetical protein